MAVNFRKVHADNIIEGADKLFLTSAERTVIADGLTKTGNLAGLSDLVASRANLGLGTAAVLNTGEAEGNVPVIGANGKLADGIIPNIAISDTTVVADIAARDALTPGTGDVAVVTDSGIDRDGDGINESLTYIFDGSVWIELLGDTSKVSSVAGKTGAITLVTADLTDVTATAEQINFLSTVTGDVQVALDSKLDDSQIDTDGTLAANSDLLVPSQAAMVTYVQNSAGAVAGSAVQGSAISAELVVATSTITLGVNSPGISSIYVIDEGMLLGGYTHTKGSNIITLDDTSLDTKSVIVNYLV